MVRVLVIPRAAYDSLAVSYPNQVRLLLDNLRGNTEKVNRSVRLPSVMDSSAHPPSSPYFDQAVLDELQDAVEMLPLTDTSLHNRLAPYLVDDLLSTTDLPEPLMDELKGEHRTCH